MIAVQHTAEGIGSKDVGKSGGRGDEGSQSFPTWPRGDDPLQRRAIVLRPEQRTPDIGEGLQRVSHGCLLVGDPGAAKAL